MDALMFSTLHQKCLYNLHNSFSHMGSMGGLSICVCHILGDMSYWKYFLNSLKLLKICKLILTFCFKCKTMTSSWHKCGIKWSIEE